MNLKKFYLIWTKAHVGVDGNEFVEPTAKQAGNKHISDYFKNIQGNWKNKFQDLARSLFPNPSTTSKVQLEE